MLSFRRSIAGIAITATAMSAAIFAAPSATADTVTVKYQCTTVIGGLWYYDWRVTLDAPAVATRGQTVTVNINMELINDLPGPRAAHTTGGSLDVSLGGASTGSTTGTTAWNPEIPPGAPLRLEGGTAQFTLANVGTVTYTPTKLLWGFVGGGAGFCSLRVGFPGQVAASTRVV